MSGSQPVDPQVEPQLTSPECQHLYLLHSYIWTVNQETPDPQLEIEQSENRSTKKSNWRKPHTKIPPGQETSKRKSRTQTANQKLLTSCLKSFQGVTWRNQRVRKCALEFSRILKKIHGNRSFERNVWQQILIQQVIYPINISERQERNWQDKII